MARSIQGDSQEREVFDAQLEPRRKALELSRQILPALRTSSRPADWLRRELRRALFAMRESIRNYRDRPDEVRRALELVPDLCACIRARPVLVARDDPWLVDVADAAKASGMKNLCD